MKLITAVEGFFLEKRLRFSKRTVEGYHYHLDYFMGFMGNVEFEAIQSDDVRRFLEWLHVKKGLSKRTVHDAWVVLSSLWTWAENELGTVHIIRRKIGRPEYTERAIEVFTKDQIKALMQAVGRSKDWQTRKGKTTNSRRPCAERDKAILLVLLDCGLRASELCALTVRDYEAERGRVHIQHGKGDKGRFAFLGDRTRKAIWRYMATRPGAKADEPLFAAGSGSHLDRNNLRHTLTRIGAVAGVAGVHPHRFRHTFAVEFLRNGGNVFELQQILGHEQLATVQRYVRLAEVDLESAGRRGSPADNWKL